MKITKYLISILALMLLFSVAIIAQEEEKDMTTDEWNAEMSRLHEQDSTLSEQVTSMQADIDKMKSTQIQSYDDCMNELYAMVGATKSDVDNFRQAVAELSGKIDRKEGPKADRQKDLNALKTNKISALPEFFDKVQNQMQSALDAWVEAPTEQMYTVVKGDYLWKIAKKKDYYGNGFAWPNIYKANKDKIKNPNLIYPKASIYYS